MTENGSARTDRQLLKKIISVSLKNQFVKSIRHEKYPDVIQTLDLSG